jgi:hypothetical protein
MILDDLWRQSVFNLSVTKYVDKHRIAVAGAGADTFETGVEPKQLVSALQHRRNGPGLTNTVIC